MEVFIGADYRGLEKKVELTGFLIEKNYEVIEQGSEDKNSNIDFNDAAIMISKAVRENFGSKGILICDSAHGMTMQANRFKGIRAANCDSVRSAKLAREHDDANVLCMSAGMMDITTMKDVALAFLTTNFEPLERRVRRINRLDEREDYD